VFYFDAAVYAEFPMNLLSMDHWTCTLWVGWHQSTIEPHQPV
jgi:hypothetical protein